MPALPKNVFDGLTDREIAEAVLTEMRSRGLFGCLFMLPSTGGASVFASSTPAGTMADQSAANQLQVFAEVATYAQMESAHKLPDETESLTPKKEWLN